MAEGKENLVLDKSSDNIRRRGGRGFLAQLALEQSNDVIVYREDFLGDAIPDEVQGVANGVGAAAPAIVADAVDGQILLDAGTANDGYSGFSLSRTCTAERKPVFTARVKITDAGLAGFKLEVGLTDAHDDAGIVNVLATPTFTATDAVAFVIDDDDTALPQFVGVDSGTAATKVEPAALVLHQADGDQLPQTGEWFTVTIALDQNGSARLLVASDDGRYHYDSDWQSGFVTPTVQLTPWVFVQNRAADQVTAHVDFVELRQNRYVS